MTVIKKTKYIRYCNVVDNISRDSNQQIIDVKEKHLKELKVNNNKNYTLSLHCKNYGSLFNRFFNEIDQMNVIRLFLIK